MLVGGGHADEIAVVSHSDAGHFGGSASVNRRERRAEAWRPENLAVQRSGELVVRRILMCASHELARVQFRQASSRHGPLVRRRNTIIAADGLYPIDLLRDFGEAQTRARSAIDDTFV